MVQRTTFPLDDHLCFAVAAAARAVTAAHVSLLAPLGLTYPQYTVMLVLWESGGPERVSDIGERLFLDSGTLTPLLKRLEAHGLVARRRAVDDERVVEIHLTAAGRALQQKAADVPRGLACKAALGADEIIALRESLKALAARLRAAD